MSDLWRNIEIVWKEDENMVIFLLSICTVLLLVDFLAVGFKPNNKGSKDDGSGWDFD